MSDKQSAYNPGETVAEVGKRWLQGLDKVDSESAYGATQRVTVELTLAGGGPAAWVLFTFDGDDVDKYGSPWDCEPLSAEFTYSEGWGQSVTLEVADPEGMWQDFRRDPAELRDES